MDEAVSGWETYEFVVAEFRKLTGVTWPESGRCCKEVRDGIPKCCYQLIDGEELTFTDREVMLLVKAEVMPLRAFVTAPAGPPINVLNREFWFGPHLEQALHVGWLADTLECAAHPTRPILIGNTVVGVAVVKDCNTPVALEHYRMHRRSLMTLWSAAVAVAGVKPYYVTDRLDDGLIVL